MYFNLETQQDVLARFHFALNTDGYLFLGKAEGPSNSETLFKPVNLKYRVFAKVPKPHLYRRGFNNVRNLYANDSFGPGGAATAG